MTENSLDDLPTAMEDFRRARFRAMLEQVLARLSGQSPHLLEYDEVRKKLRATAQLPRGLQNIPLDAIIGSVGRTTDFTRSFLPRRDSDERRWARVKLGMTDLTGLPPIDVYQIDQAYFVLDGNHRVSVARQLGATHIQAYVTEVQIAVPLSPDIQPDDLILKAEYAAFLGRTRLDRLRPDADLGVSVPGQYEKLEEHISVHCYFMGIDQGKEIPYEEAVIHWYDTLYLPMVRVIRGRGMLRDFPDRTEADLYLWIVEHRAALAEEVGWEARPESAAADLIARFSRTPQRIANRIRRRIVETVAPDGLTDGAPTGEWRQERFADRPQDRLFADILVAVDGQEGGWQALEWTLDIARREQARLCGLHAVPSKAQRESEAVRTVQAEFERRCSAAGVQGTLISRAGSVPRLVCEWARLMDLVVLSLSHPYAPQPLARLGSGLHTIIRRCPTPVVAVPRIAPHLERVLLAYDGSPKAQEALFVAAYLACCWDVSLVVLTIRESEHVSDDALARARAYLADRGVQASFVQQRGPVAQEILLTAEQQGIGLIVVGGYGFSPLVESAFGSTVGDVLRSSPCPVLICQ